MEYIALAVLRSQEAYQERMLELEETQRTEECLEEFLTGEDDV